MKNLVKLLTAIAAVAGVVYVVATYGDKIVAWAKKLVDSCPRRKVVTVTIADEVTTSDEASEEATSCEEATVEEETHEETPVVAEGEPVAEEADFEA